MKSCDRKCGYRYTWISLLMFIAAAFLLFGMTGCEEDDPLLDVYDMSGRYEMMYANFLVPVDLDGDGPLTNTTDAKSLLYDLLDVQSECDSDVEVIFTFADTIFLGDEPALLVTCTDNQASKTIASYVPNANATLFHLYKPALNDPIHLINWQGSMLFLIAHKQEVNGRTKLSGYTGLISNYNMDKSMEIEFAFKEVAEVKGD